MVSAIKRPPFTRLQDYIGDSIPGKQLPAFKRGDFVKVHLQAQNCDACIMGGESFWVEIAKVCMRNGKKSKRLQGTVENKLVAVDPAYLKYGDKVDLHRDCVYTFETHATLTVLLLLERKLGHTSQPTRAYKTEKRPWDTPSRNAMGSASSIAAAVAPTLAPAKRVCSRCKRTSYASVAEQTADWAHHRHRCVAYDAEQGRAGIVTLAGLLQPECVRRLLGPYLDAETKEWRLDPEADLVRVFSMVDLECLNAAARFSIHSLPIKEQDILNEQKLPWPKTVLQQTSRVWSSEEVTRALADPATAKLALPSHVVDATKALSLEQYWQWVARNKCDIFSTGVALALKELVTKLDVPLRYQGVGVVEFGTVSAVYTKSYVPIQTQILLPTGESSSPLPDWAPIGGINSPCLHRFNYFRLANGKVVLVDFAAAQYGNLPGLDKAACLPVVVIEGGEKEALAHGYRLRSDSFLPISDVRYIERIRGYMRGCASHQQEAIYHLRETLFRRIAGQCKLDLVALLAAHPSQTAPPVIACSRLNPGVLHVHRGIEP